jgi:hypothetical protein
MLLFVIVGTLLAAACSSTDSTEGAGTDGATTTESGGDTTDPDDTSTDTSEGGGPATTEEGDVVVEPYRGVTDDTIKIGIPVNDVKVFAPVGDIQPRFEALVNATNEAGGINGRMIEPVFLEWGIAERDRSDAACITFTEDEEVFLVVGFLVGGWNDFSCYTRNDTVVITSTDLQLDDAEGTDGMAFTVDPASSNNLLQGLPAMEEQLAGQVVGVWGGATEEALVDEVVAVIEGLGAAEVLKGLQQVGGSDDLVAAENEVDVTLENFAANGVEWIVSMSPGQTGGILAGLSRAARLDTNVVNPGTETGALTALGADLADFPNLFSLGPPARETLYIDGLHGAPECVDMLAETLGISIAPYPPEGEDDPLSTTVGTCAAWDAFTAVAEAAGRNLTTETFLAAGEELNTFPMTGSPSGSLIQGRLNMPNSDSVLYQYSPTDELFELVE